MNWKAELAALAAEILNEKATGKGLQVSPAEVLINLTPGDFTGDYTLVLFPFVKKLGMNPAELGEWVGGEICRRHNAVQNFNLVKGFLNLELKPEAWVTSFTAMQTASRWGFSAQPKGAVMMEYPSPNTNKPLHLGHLRNIFLGFSLSRIFEACGYTVHQVCLFNDRGTNISKSMLAYLKSADKRTPENSGTKGDKLVGDYYVEYANLYKQEIQTLMAGGMTEEEAKKASTLQEGIDDLTIRWEAGDAEVRQLWTMMNGWFYQGVHQTFDALGLHFHKEYYESDIYNRGRETVKEGLEKGVFFRKEDGSVWIDLTDIGLDQKVVLRSNGTTVYITQDIALAYQKQQEFDFQQSVYVVGNEQDYHFKVLFEILRRLGMKASDKLYHLSYGMVELPTGKMKSREGTVVDADDLMAEVIRIAREKADEQGKLAEMDAAGREESYRQIGLGALRYFILKVDPVKKMIFNPEDSIDFNGNTAPFIQYMHARICSLQRNAAAAGIAAGAYDGYTLNGREQKLLRLLLEFPDVLNEAAQNYSPALVANYVYQLAADFSAFYHDYKVLKEEDTAARSFRMQLCALIGSTLRDALYLLGIDAPERM